MNDIVYIVKKGDFNEELRYSLRSIKNLKYNNVFIAGYMPNWVTGVYEIPVKQTHDIMKNTYNNILAACRDNDLTENIILMHDDMFIMKPTDVKPYIRGYYKEILAAYQERNKYSLHITRMKNTMDYLLKQGVDNPRCFELHIPFVINRQKFLNINSRVGDGYRYNKLSLYGNLVALEDNGVMKDVKVNERVYTPRGAYISTHERSFHHKPIGKYIRRKFSEASQYEK